MEHMSHSIWGQKLPVKRRPPKRLPREVGKRLVGFGHAVHLVLFLNGVAFVLGGEEELGGELLCHRLALLGTRRADNPAE